MSGLLDLAVEANGGAKRWERLRSFDAKVSLGGALLAAKGWPAGLRDTRVWLDATRPWVVCAPFPEPGQRGIFERTRVSIESADGTPAAARREIRSECVGMSPDARWDALHLLYFASYAIWSNLCLPVLLMRPDVESREINAWEVQDGVHWRRLFVRFPPTIPVHCQDQVLYFDNNGLLRRLDYVPEPAGAGAAAVAHYCLDHKAFDGLVLPTRHLAFASPDNVAPDRKHATLTLDLADVRPD